MKDNYCPAEPVKCPVDVSSPGNPTYQSQQEGKKEPEKKDKKKS